jgi:hypothetical protein
LVAGQRTFPLEADQLFGLHSISPTGMKAFAIRGIMFVTGKNALDSLSID